MRDLLRLCLFISPETSLLLCKQPPSYTDSSCSRSTRSVTYARRPGHDFIMLWRRLPSIFRRRSGRTRLSLPASRSDHNVIASRWEVTDSSTEQLMDRFYDELDNGASPDAALRAAKLSLLRG